LRLLPIALLLGGCAWSPKVVGPYPSGLIIIRGDQRLLDGICSHLSDKGVYIEHAAGCYQKEADTVYVLDNCEGAKALTHELAHREGIYDPEKEGYNW